MRTSSALAGIVSISTGYLSCSTVACAQTESAKSLVPRSGWYVGIGAGFNTVDFGSQDIYTKAATNINLNGARVDSGTVAGSGTVHADSQSSFAPSVQGGY